MLFPYGTDAPVYHPPIATIGIIVINAAMFLTTGMGCRDYGEFDWLILEFDRINPLQWVTAAFMHASWIHLIGNMIFLWCFGLVIEGRLGWRRFSGLYLGLTLADGAVGQIPMFLFSDGVGGALGASGVVFAMIVIAMIWDPESEIHCVYVWGLWFVGSVDIPILMVGGFYVAVEFLQIGLIGWRMSTPMLHLLGAAVGIPFAIYMLQTKRVDCEGGDLLSRLGWNGPLQAKHFNILWFVGRLVEAHERQSERGADQSKTTVRSAPEPAKQYVMADQSASVPRDPCAAAVQAFARAVSARDVDGSIGLMSVLKRGRWIPGVSDSTLSRFVKLLSAHGKQEEQLLPLRHLVQRNSRSSNDACLVIANIERKRENFVAAQTALNRMKQPFTLKQAQYRSQISRSISSVISE